MLSIVFRIQYVTVFGEDLYIKYGKNNFLQLEWSHEHFWKGSIEIEKNTTLNWHYLVMNGDKVRRVEEISNDREYIFESNAVICDFWAQPSCTEIFTIQNVINEQIEKEIVEVKEEVKKEVKSKPAFDSNTLKNKINSFCQSIFYGTYMRHCYYDSTASGIADYVVSLLEQEE
ncbi:Uncharacterized protein QTN25_007683 [Entamoeba marina]